MTTHACHVGEVVPLDVTRLGRFQILKHLATGGMAEVLLARADGPFGVDHVVVKRVRRDQASDPQFVKMFLDEAALASLLDHPNIVKVHEVGNEQGEHFFAMEYIHGEDLRRVLMEVNQRRDKLPIALITGIVAAAAAGLDHAHRQVGANGEALRIVHRDVSPANILVAYDGRVKVADFGIAKAALRSVETRSGTLKGKVSYMSPEQVTGAPVDQRSDVFALGIVLYEVATARRLFKGDNDFLTMSAIVQGDIPLPSVHRPDLPRILEDIIMKALSQNPLDRYQTAEQLRVELERFTHAIGMRMSTESIADYMRTLFGSRAEPWLVAEFEPTQTTTTDFDGSASGLVHPPEAAVHHQSVGTFAGVRPQTSSPIMMSRSAVTTCPPTEQVPTIGPPGDHGWHAKSPTATGSGEVMTRGAAPTSRRRLAIVLGMSAVATLAGVVLVLGVGRAGDPEREAAAPVAAPASGPVPVAAEPAAAAHSKPAVAADPDAVAADPNEVAAEKAARATKAEAATKAEIATQAALEAKAAQAEAERLARADATARAETAKTAKADAARLARADAAARAETAKAARAETAQAARLARAERAQTAAARSAPSAAAKPVAAAQPVAKPAATKPKATAEPKWNPNSLFPE